MTPKEVTNAYIVIGTLLGLTVGAWELGKLTVALKFSLVAVADPYFLGYWLNGMIFIVAAFIVFIILMIIFTK